MHLVYGMHQVQQQLSKEYLVTAAQGKEEEEEGTPSNSLQTVSKSHFIATTMTDLPCLRCSLFCIFETALLCHFTATDETVVKPSSLTVTSEDCRDWRVGGGEGEREGERGGGRERKRERGRER